jgi:hypothetical protein
MSCRLAFRFNNDICFIRSNDFVDRPSGINDWTIHERKQKSRNLRERSSLIAKI